MADNLIPIDVYIPPERLSAPERFISSVRQGMGLGIRDFKIFTAGNCTLMAQYLDLSQKIWGQDPDKWDAYRRAVIDKFPFVSRYEDAWPIARYAKGHLSYESRRRPKDIGAAAAERKQDQNIGPHRYHPYKESDNDEYIPTNISSVGKDVKPTTQDVQIPDIPMARGRRAQGSLPLEHRGQHSNGDERELGKNAAGPKRQPRFNHAVSIEGTSTSSSSSKLTGDFDAVKAFLHDLSPPMVILAPKFWDAGIITLEHVRAVARMPKEQKDILLKDEMRLTRFESVSIYMGLDALQDSR